MRRLPLSGAALATVCALLLVISGCTTGSSAAGTTASSGGAMAQPKVLAQKQLTAKSGGSVSADGVTLVVPADALEANGAVAITAEGNGIFDLSLTAPWHGKLHVTMPLARPSDIVMHQVGGIWIPEGTAPGQSTVTVTHLSLFAPLSSLGSKVANALCLKQDPVKFLNCLLGKGLTYVDKSMAQALLGKALNACESSLLAQADSGSTAGVLIGTLIKIFTGACVGKAGEGDWSPPVTSTPSLPSNGGPIQGGNVPIQGGAPPVQGGTTPTPTATASGSNGQLLVQLSNFPTGTTYYFCHVGSGYPTGGTIAGNGSVNITSAGENLGALCSGSGNFWIGFQGTDGHDYYSNQVTLG